LVRLHRLVDQPTRRVLDGRSTADQPQACVAAAFCEHLAQEFVLRAFHEAGRAGSDRHPSSRTLETRREILAEGDFVVGQHPERETPGSLARNPHEIVS
jgi:hypothetical protein